MPQSLKIAIIYLDLSSPEGAARFALSSARALKDLGHKVSIVTLRHERECYPELANGLDIRILPFNLKPIEIKKLPGVLGKIEQKLRKRKFYAVSERIAALLEPDLDIINCQDDYSHRIGYYYKKRNPSAKVVWTMHNPPFSYYPKNNAIKSFASWLVNEIESIMERPYLKGIDLVTTLDERNREIASKLGLNVRVIYNGVDYDYFYHPVKELRGKVIKLISVGSLSPYRRFEDTIHAVALLRRHGYDARATIVTLVKPEMRVYMDDLLKLCHGLDIQDYIDFRYGISDPDLRRIYQESDIFIFPNHIRIWGMAPFEAMAAGLPLIVSDVTSLAEVLRDGGNALFTKPRLPGDIAEKAKILVDNPALYKKIAEAGQRFVKKELSWEKFGRNLLSAIGKSA